MGMIIHSWSVPVPLREVHDDVIRTHFSSVCVADDEISCIIAVVASISKNELLVVTSITITIHCCYYYQRFNSATVYRGEETISA
jgi:hypothetical protein